MNRDSDYSMLPDIAFPVAKESLIKMANNNEVIILFAGTIPEILSGAVP